MGATGVCWDNAAAESFFGTLKRELAHRRRWATRAEARRETFLQDAHDVALQVQVERQHQVVAGLGVLPTQLADLLAGDFDLVQALAGLPRRSLS